MLRIAYNSARVIRGKLPGLHMQFIVTDDPVGSAPTHGADYPDKDIVFTDVTYSGSVLNKQILPLEVDIEESFTFTSLTPDIVSVNEFGYCTQISAGSAEVLIQSSMRGSGIYRWNAKAASAITRREHTTYVAGSLGRHCQDAIAGLILGKDPASTSNTGFWSTVAGDIDSPSLARSSTMFAAGYDWSGISVMASNRPNDSRPMTLISPRHAMTAAHWQPAIGERILFQRQNGTFQEVTVASKSNVPTESAYDLAVVCFNEEVTGFKIYKTMPSNWHLTYAPSAEQAWPHGSIPYLRKSRHHTDDSGLSSMVVNTMAGVFLSYTDSSSGVTYDPTSWYMMLATLGVSQVDMRGWAPRAIAGDSSSPSFFIINNEPVLISCQWMQSRSGMLSSAVAFLNTEMNVMAGVAPGTYALTHPNLSAFTDFSV